MINAKELGKILRSLGQKPSYVQDIMRWNGDIMV